MSTPISQDPHQLHAHGSGVHVESQTWKFHVDVTLRSAFNTDHVHCLQGQFHDILFARENLDVSIPVNSRVSSGLSQCIITLFGQDQIGGI